MFATFHFSSKFNAANNYRNQGDLREIEKLNSKAKGLGSDGNIYRFHKSHLQ